MTMRSSFDKINPDWYADTAMADLIAEQDMLPEETPISIGLKDMNYYFPLAVRRIGQIAVHGEEKYALTAAKYIISANLAIEKARASGGDDPVDAFAKQVLEDASRMNGG
jgi:hypothetical protein